MKQTKTSKKKTSWGRVILGTFVAYSVFALIGFFMFMANGWGIVNPGESILAWFLFPLLSLVALLYAYGWIGHWLAEMEGERNFLFRWIGKIFGGLGYLLWSFPLMAFGANKKYLFVLLVALPLTVLGVVSIIFGIVGVNVFSLPLELKGNWSPFYYALGVFALLNALFVLFTKKCPNCGCLMSKIGYDSLSFETDIYTREYSRTIGTISDGKGNYADVNEVYDVAHEGYANTVAKTFTCKNCNTKKQGRAHTIHTMSYDDLRRSS